MYWICHLLLLMSISWTRPMQAAPSAQRIAKQNAMLQNGVKTLMGYKDLPLGEKGVVRGTPDGRVVPRYMLDLYSKFKNTDIVTGGGLANTVRSISAEIGLVNGDSMFIFNLTAVHSTEDILSSDVHIYRKKRRSDTPLTVTLYELAPYYITELGKSRLREGKSGWQVFSVTEAVRSCLATRRATPHILALGFSRTKTGGALKRLQLKSFIHHISRPFLVVHSNSNVNITEDHIHARLSEDKNTYINPENGKTETFRKKQKVPTKQETKSTETEMVKQDTRVSKEAIESGKDSMVIKTKKDSPIGYKQEVLRRKLTLQKKQNEARRKRSILTNEIPEDPTVPLIPPNKHKSSKKQTHMKRQREFSMEDFDFKDQQRKTSLSQENHKKRRRKQKSKANLKNKPTKTQQGSNRQKNELPSPEEWGLVYSAGTQSADKKLCARQKLVLDFTDIGWSNWIIAPKAFDSNYCAGRCPYPQSQNLPGLSNHATLQSLVHAVAINPQVPAPCCVPAEMTSLSVLYFDQYDNVVLKNYPNMAVKSCQCQ